MHFQILKTVEAAKNGRRISNGRRKKSEDTRHEFFKTSANQAAESSMGPTKISHTQGFSLNIFLSIHK